MLVVILPLMLFAQDRLPSAEINAPNLPAQKIGADDLLAVSVYGAPELTRTVRVSGDGLIRLPMVKEKIEARGLMPAELEQRIAQALVAEEILVDPAVTVTVAEYHSRPISVVGAVRRPLTFQAYGNTTLLEALARAEGLAEDAGSEILITRSGSTERIPVKALIDAADPKLNLVLEGGEEVRVPQAGRVFVVGNVKKPGAFRIEDASGMTVLKALAMAEGLAPFATRQAYIYRHGTEETVDLRRILDRKSPDILLAASDIFYIPDNRKARVTTNVLEKTVGFAASTASGILILSHP
ncbi:MAG TPA: polysaccharide biosynthesis/export family protein [Bryobacteraceae bacterium]|nr:polysaccharide biosynthesis/export family protein [Bryobacteraceae bacterium]